jgi:hypothetical protein
MKHIKSVMVACLTLASSSSVFGTFSFGETYYLDTTATGWSGSITLDSTSGSWTSPSQGYPIVSFDIITPTETFDSANPDVSLVTSFLNPASITWDATGITDINLEFTNSDPGILSFMSPVPGPTLTFTVTTTLAYSGSDPLTGTGSLDPAQTPDDSQTWLLLAGVCAALGAPQVLNRRGRKLAVLENRHHFKNPLI